jgi:hypothetical protein
MRTAVRRRDTMGRSINALPISWWLLDVIVRHEFTNQATKMPLAERQDPKHSSLIDRPNCSACALQFGAAGGVDRLRENTLLGPSIQQRVQ